MQAFSKVVVTIVLFVCVYQVYAVTKDEVAKKIMKKKETPNIAYKATMKTKVYVQGQSITDSGFILLSPPDCYKIEMIKGKTKISILGDTTWTTMPNGSVTRQIGGKEVPGMGGISSVGQSYEAPDISSMLKRSDFTIIEEKPGKHVVIEFNMQMPQGGEQKAQATFDTKEWLVRNMKIPGGPVGTIETGYNYTKLKGFSVIKEISMVMGPMGFMKIKYENYKVIKKMPRKKFREF